MSGGRVLRPTTGWPSAIAPDDTSTTRCPAAWAAASSPQSLTTASSSTVPSVVVTDELPTLTTTFTTGLSRRDLHDGPAHRRRVLGTPHRLRARIATGALTPT